jgi:hypothetical protein
MLSISLLLSAKKVAEAVGLFRQATALDKQCCIVFLKNATVKSVIILPASSEAASPNRRSPAK